MRLKISLTSESNIVLPMHYNYILQSFIYNNMDSIYSTFLHSQGFAYEKRHFKLFTFSNIFGKRKIIKAKKRIIFYPPIHFYVSFIMKEALSSHAKSLITKNKLKLGNNILNVSSIEVIEEKAKSNQATVKTLSPVTIHSTDSNRKTIYYNPYENSFYTLLERNLWKKCNLSGLEITLDDIKILPAENSRFKKAVIIYKRDYVIESWKGKFILKAPEEAVNIALTTGIGDRNSMGFGMIAIC